VSVVGFVVVFEVCFVIIIIIIIIVSNNNKVFSAPSSTSRTEEALQCHKSRRRIKSDIKNEF